MVLAQGNLDVAILGADDAGVVIGQVDAAWRQADVVDQGADFIGRNDATDRVLDRGKAHCGFLHPGAGRHPGMQQDLAAVDRGEEVAAQEWQQGKRCQHKGHEAQHKPRPMAQSQLEQIEVTIAEALEAQLKGALEMHQRVAGWRQGRFGAMHVGMGCMRAQQVFRHRRHQGARKHERAGHREHHRFGHRHEQEARYALQEEHRHENDADAQQRDECRGDDLVRTVHDGGLDILALFEMPVDVFNRHRGIVDQNPDRQREAAEGHDIERLADRCQPDDRAEDRQRDRHRDDHGRTPASQKQQNHQAGQSRGDDAFDRDAADRRADKNRLVIERHHRQLLGP